MSSERMLPRDIPELKKRSQGVADARNLQLTVPFRRLVGRLEALVWEEGEAWTLVAGSEDDHVALDFFFTSWSLFGHALRAVVEEDAVLGEADDVAAEPFCSVRPDLVKNIGVYHGCLGEEAL